MKKLITTVLILVSLSSSGQSTLDSLVITQDPIQLKAFIKKWDLYFHDNWKLESAVLEEIDHFENGYVLTWAKEENGIAYRRAYTFNLSSLFVRAHEQRFINDTLLSQGDVNFENRQVNYIRQVIINKSSLKKEKQYWDYDVDGYHFEIYSEGKLMCIYKTIHLNHYSMLFDKKNKDKIELVSGTDYLKIR